MSNGNLITDSNQKWVLGGAAIIITLTISLGGMVASTQQSQINKNQDKIWSLQSTAVTDDKLDRQINTMIQ